MSFIGRRSRLIEIDWCSTHYAVHGYHASGFRVNLLLRHRLRGGVERNPGFMCAVTHGMQLELLRQVDHYLQAYPKLLNTRRR